MQRVDFDPSRRQLIAQSGTVIGAGVLGVGLFRGRDREPNRLKCVDQLRPGEDLTTAQWEHLREATVRTFTNFSTCPTDKVLTPVTASGFCVGERAFVTNQHVVNRGDIQQLRGVSLGHPTYKVIRGEVVWVDDDSDVALLEVPSRYEGSFTPVDMTMRLPEEGEPIFSTTYQADTLNRGGTNVLHRVRSRVLGVYQGVQYPGYQGQLVCATDIDPNDTMGRFGYGASGSPVADKEGKVFGTIHAIVVHGVTPQGLDQSGIDVARYFGIEMGNRPSLGFVVPLNSEEFRERCLALGADPFKGHER